MCGARKREAIDSIADCVKEVLTPTSKGKLKIYGTVREKDKARQRGTI
jgi:hypothetical protein